MIILLVSSAGCVYAETTADTAFETEPVEETLEEPAQDPEVIPGQEPEAAILAEPAEQPEEEPEEEPEAEPEAKPQLTGAAPTTAGDEYGNYYTVEGVTGGKIRFSPDTGLITGCESGVTSADIPDTIDGVTVVGIRQYAFQNKTNLTNITIGNSITSIGEGAFQRSGIEEITIPGSVSDVGQWAFMDCAALKRVVLEDGVVNILSSAFKNDAALESVSLPSSLARIDNYAFRDCESLSEVTYGGIPFYPFSQTDVTIGDNVFTNCPFLNSDFSQSYTGSWYYHKLNETEPSGDIRADILAIAKSQLGYHEGNSEAEQHGLNRNGNGNYTEYNYWWGEPGTNWCGEFAGWCIAMASVPTEVVGRKYHTPDEDTYTWSDTRWGGGSYELSPGDVIFFSEDHIVIVLSVTEEEDTLSVRTINGNHHNNVSYDTYLIDHASGEVLGSNSYEGHVETIYAPDVSKASLATYHTITFNPNGGSVSYGTKGIADNAYFGAMPIPTLSGHTFAGWYTEADGGRKITAYQRSQLTDDTTLYAHWTDGETPYPDEPEGNGEGTEYFTVDGQYWGIRRSDGCIVSAPRDFRSGAVPARIGDIDVAAIGDYAFMNNANITQIDIPAGVTSIGCGAFMKCVNLKKVTVPTSVNAIDDYAFMNCYDLETVAYSGAESSITFGRRVYAGTLFVRPDLSSAYKGSRYYQKLCAADLSGDIRSDVLAIAASQEGYHEGNNASQLDGSNTSGNGDFAEYNYFTHSPDWKWRPGLAEYYDYGGWCGNFCDWVMAMASIPNEATQLRGNEEDDLHWSDTTYAGGSYNLLPGDVIHMELGHFAIVIDSHESDGIVSIDTWNGNHSNNVCRDTYRIRAADGTNIDNARYSINAIYPLYPAKYDALDKIRVSFDACGGTCAQSAKDYAYNACFGVLPQPERSGYSFDGWYTGRSDGYKITSYRRMHFSTDTTLYARWKANEPERPKNVSVYYRTHVQNIGWQGYVSNGAVAGTSGRSLRLEGINIYLSGNPNLGIQYTTHCQDYGWLVWSANNEMSGTTGEAKRLEAIMINLTGADSGYYDVYYRVHAQDVGWMGWAKNGQPAGTAGYARRLEAIQILVVQKGTPINVNTGGIRSVTAPAYISGTGGTPYVPYSNLPNLAYRTHVQNIGWQGWMTNGGFAGTSGRALRLEAIIIRMTNKRFGGGIRYKTHVQNIGWQDWVYDGAMSGTSGRALRLEAINIELYGDMARHYDIYYRVHAQDVGWMGWAKNGASAGTAGYSRRLEGIQIVIVEKDAAGPGIYYGGIVQNYAGPFLSR